MAVNNDLKKIKEEKNELLKRMLVRKGVRTLAGLIGGKVLVELGDVDILDVLDIPDAEESNKLAQ